MWKVARRIGEEVVILVGDVEVRVTVVETPGSKVWLGFTAPKEVVLRRAELHDSEKKRSS